MDLNNIEFDSMDAEEKYGGAEAFEPDVGASAMAPSSGDSGPSSSMLAMMQEMRAEQQRLFAMIRDRPRSKTPSAKVPNVTAEEVRICRERGLCIKCKKPGHLARDCKHQGTTVRLN